MSHLYHNYFAKDKPLRHYSQHLLVALIAFLLITQILNIERTRQTISLFLVFSFLIDLDGLLAIFTTQRKKSEVVKIKKALSEFNFNEAATLATTHHKIFDRLVFHNVIGLSGFTLLFIFFVVNKSDIEILTIGALLAHFSFDIFDDVYQLGNINNWLWPITSLRKLL